MSSQVLAIPSKAEVFHCDMERSCKPQAFNENAFINCYLLSITEVNLYRDKRLKTSCYYIYIKKSSFCMQLKRDKFVI